MKFLFAIVFLFACFLAAVTCKGYGGGYGGGGGGGYGGGGYGGGGGGGGKGGYTFVSHSSSGPTGGHGRVIYGGGGGGGGGHGGGGYGYGGGYKG
ncbi:hypothetical protein TYRP_001170 [Tyrophagus putrescentiae]|nr:hypothetical protein TYRP_001170 [Tyrophagus putrescentiae]